MAQASDGAPPITVTIATNDGWAVTRQAYEPLRDQVERIGGEFIVLDGSGGPGPGEGEMGPTSRYVASPGTDLAELRMTGYREARGEIVAMLEDHVIVPPDWVATLLAVHAEHPEIAAVGGAVRNGTPRHVIDRASFYAGHAPYMNTLPTGPVPYLDGAYVAYKGKALRDAIERLGDRAIETLINEEIKADGGTLYVDERLYVSHLQSRGVVGTTRLHYYAGRHFEGTRQSNRRDGAKRLARAVVLPLPRVARRLAVAHRQGEPLTRLAVATPAMMLLFTAQATGEVVGIVRGPGRAAAKLH